MERHHRFSVIRYLVWTKQLISQRKINQKLKKCFKEIENETRPAFIIKALDTSFKNLGIRFLWLNDEHTPKNSFETWGYFIPDKKHNKIQIVLLFNKSFEKLIINDELIFDISVTIQHELRHLEQYVNRGNRWFDQKSKMPNPHKISELEEIYDYLAIPDEIDAYALSAILEMSFYSPHTDFLSSLEYSITYQNYSHFPDLKPRILKKIYKLYRQGVRWDL